MYKDVKMLVLAISIMLFLIVSKYLELFVGVLPIIFPIIVCVIISSFGLNYAMEKIANMGKLS